AAGARCTLGWRIALLRDPAAFHGTIDRRAPLWKQNPGTQGTGGTPDRGSEESDRRRPRWLDGRPVCRRHRSPDARTLAGGCASRLGAPESSRPSARPPARVGAHAQRNEPSVSNAFAIAGRLTDRGRGRRTGAGVTTSHDPVARGGLAEPRGAELRGALLRLEIHVHEPEAVAEAGRPL